MKKLQFKRKKSGGGADYGSGWDHLLRNFYDDLDKITEDSFYSRHDEHLIHKVHSSLLEILESKAIPMMQKIKNEFSEEEKRAGCEEWVEKATVIKTFFYSAKTVSHKVIAIDSLTQFLRETNMEDRESRENKPEKYKPIKEVPLIKGNPASKGLTQGKVRVVINLKKDGAKMKKGDILVTDETDASFLPLMMKAKAIITDTGGLLCHAAIVSRELNVPCITGTKIATKSLKDGDLVEVDADKGTVKILK